MAAAVAGHSFLITGVPGSGKSTKARAIIEAVAPHRPVWVISYTHCAVAQLRFAAPNVHFMTCDRFLKKVLHRQALRTPCCVVWDEVFFVLFFFWLCEKLLHNDCLTFYTVVVRNECLFA